MVVAVIIALLLLLGLSLAWRGLRCIWRRPLRGSAHLCGGSLFLALAAVTWLTALNLLTYQRLTAEQAVAELSFEQLGPQEYAVTLQTADGQRQQHLLRGDDWQLDARILKWQGPAIIAGLDTRFRLERLSGRYRDIDQERNERRSVIELAPPQVLDVWALAEAHPRWLPLVDAVYGSATYLKMRDGAVYEVNVTSSGLIAREKQAML
ncbi:MAG: hypothetical protein Tsb002_18800 [Wenzhouxiangellaceae bacterium]